jgi:hypothetical protein
MRPDSTFILQIHADTAPVITIERFENDWISYFVGGSDSALLVSDSNRRGNRQSGVAYHAIGQILVESDVGCEMALGGDVGGPNAVLVFAESELQQ